MAEDRFISHGLAEALADKAGTCQGAAILQTLVDHSRSHDETQLCVDAALADLIGAALLLIGTQNEAWRNGAMATVTRIIERDHDDPQFITTSN